MRILIAYYSRTGITKKACSKLADILIEMNHQAHLLEIQDETNRKGITGWIKGGRDAWKKRSTDIQYEPSNIEDYDLVVVGTPVWAFTMTPAIRTFLIEDRIHIPKAAFLCTMGGSGDKKTFIHMEEAFESTPVATISLIDKKVKKDDQTDFLDKIQNFANNILS